jgi:hypothetical protein
MNLKLKAICEQFRIYGDYIVGVPFGCGHINDTYQITYDQGGIRLHYALQRINHNVFKHPTKVMDNMARVTRHLLAKIHALNMETRKRTIRLLETREGLPYVVDAEGYHWRAYIFIENARTYDILESEDQAYRAARTFGQFQCDLVDLPGGRLHETIPDFHHTPKRIDALERAVKADRCGRAKKVAREVDFVMERREEAGLLIKLNSEGQLPERITHNDTKLNNVLIDDFSGEGICVIDLDTVMPGLALYDFGDMVRSGTSPAAEDEQDLTKVFMQFNMFEALLRGYLDGAGNFLTPVERELLPFSGKLITLEIGTRFLADFIEGDIYFKTGREAHNLDRARAQFKLVESIEAQFDRMHELLKTL